MRATEFIIETAMMGKIADSGKIIRILKKAHTVPFSDEKNWLLVDTDPGKGNSGLGIKWIPADTRFEWVRPYKDTVDENLSPQTIHKLADRKGVRWDNEPSFLQLTKRLTGKEHLDDLDHSGLNKVKRHLDGLQGMAEGFSNDMSTEDMIAYLRQHHDTNLHQDYLDHINTFSKFVLKDIPVNSIKTDLPKLDRAKVEQYKQMDFSKAPPIVMGGGYILDGYHRANVAKALGIPTIKAYVGVKDQQGVAEGSGFDQEAGIGIDGKSFKFKIRDLVALADNYPVTKIDPQQFSKQIAGRDEDSTQSMARAEKADLQYPIIVVKRQNGQLWIADGTHRAHKAIMHKLPSINAKIIPIKDMAPFDVDKGVAEGQDDKAEAYRAHLIKTLPQIMKLFANIGKGWIPGKEQMLSAVDTAYIVMKHTGDVKQAGKVLMDELNTLYRMSQGKQGVAEEETTHWYNSGIKDAQRDAKQYPVQESHGGYAMSPLEWLASQVTPARPNYIIRKIVVIGDSIAVGIGQAIKGAVVNATVGINSSKILSNVSRDNKVQGAKLAIVSAGSNDIVKGKGNPQKLTANIAAIKDALNAEKYVWILPYDKVASQAVSNAVGGDKTVDLKSYPSSDGLHPSSYSDVAKAARAGLNLSSTAPGALRTKDGLQGVAEDQKINLDTDYFMNEGCGIFAVATALNEPGSQIYIISNKEGESWSKSFPYEITHVFANIPGKGQHDVRGKRSLEEMASDFGLDKGDYSVKGPFDPKEFFTKFMGNSDSKPLYGTVKDIKQVQKQIQPALKQGVAEGSLNEFAPGSSNGGGDDSLFNYAKMWYNGDLKTQQQVEKALQKSGLDIGENEDENGGAYISDMSGDYYESWTAEDLEQGVAEEMQHKKITELFDAKTAFPLQWDNQFASIGEVHAEAYDADGRTIDISFTPTGYGSGIEIVFKRGGSYDMTGHGDAPRVLATVVNAISQYLQKYQPPYIAFSAKSTGGRAGAYAAMIRRLARGYKLLTPDEYPDDTAGFLDFLGSDKPFILARS